MVVVSRRDKRAEILGQALSGTQKEAPQTDEIVYGGTTTNQSTVTQPQPSVYDLELQKIDEQIAELEAQKANLPSVKEARAEITAQEQAYIQRMQDSGQRVYASVRAGYSKKRRRVKDQITSKFRKINSQLSELREKRKTVTQARTKQISIQAQKDYESKYEAQQRSNQAQQDRNQEAFIASQGQEAWNESSPEAKQRIRESYLRDVSRPRTIVGETDVNQLAQQYETAGEFLPEIQRRESRGETLRVQRQSIAVDVTPNQSYYKPEANYTKASGEAVYVSPQDARRPLYKADQPVTPGSYVISAGTGRNILSENIRAFEQRERRLFPESLQQLERSVPFLPGGTLARETKFFFTPSPEIQATQSMTLPSSSAVTFEAEGWTTSRGRRAGVTLFKEGVTDTVAGISGRVSDRLIFATSVVAPAFAGKSKVATGTVGRIAQSEAWQAGKDVVTAGLISAFVGGSREQPAPFTAGQFAPYFAGSAGTLVYRGGQAVVTSPRTKAFVEAFNVKAYELKKDLRTGTKLLLETRSGKRGTAGRKPKSLAQRSKESRGQIRQQRDIRQTAIDILRKEARPKVVTIRSDQAGRPTSMDVRTVNFPSQPKKAKVSRQVPASETRLIPQQPKPPQQKTVRKPKEVRVVYGTELKGATRKETVAIYTDRYNLSKRQARRLKGQLKARGLPQKKVLDVPAGEQVAVQQPLQKIGKVGQQTLQPKKPKPAKRRELSQREPDTKALDGLGKGRFDNLFKKRKQYALVEEEQAVAPKGFRPGTREAVLGRVQAFKQERLTQIERQPIFPAGTRERPVVLKGLGTGSVLTPITASNNKIDIKPLADTKPSTDIIQTVVPASTIKFGQAQAQAQEQTFAQDLAFKYAPIFEQPKTTKPVTEPGIPGSRPPRPPRQTQEVRPRQPVPKIPKEPRPREPKRPFPKIPTIKIPLIPLPDFAPLRTKAFDVYANIKGDFVKLNKQELTKSQALTQGAKLITTTPLASFQIAETGNYLQEEDEGINKRTRKLFKQFRKPKRSSKLRTNDYTFVEKSKYRIDTPGELSGITYKGLATRRRL